MTGKLAAPTLRRQFLLHLLDGLKLVWPIIAALVGLIAAMGCIVAVIEDWSVFDGIYFAFVSGLTIGFGVLAPKFALGRAIAVAIGFTGIVLTGLVAAVAVQAPHATLQARNRD